MYTTVSPPYFMHHNNTLETAEGRVPSFFFPHYRLVARYVSVKLGLLELSLEKYRKDLDHRER